VLLITVDTLRADALGAYGHASAVTPWIDRLAREGVRFDRAHAHNVVTLPSHANIMSGLLPTDHGVRDNAGFRFPQSIDTIATILKAHGYRTGAFISAFPLDARFGLARGFDEYDDRFVDATPRPAFLEQERRGTETVAHARAWLAAEYGQPTFCWIHLYEPHFPYAPPEPFASRFPGVPYDGDVAAADDALKPLLEPILSRGREGGTLVLFTSDHGESLGEHGEATHGIFAYEATLRVPLILYAPSILPPRTVSAPARHVDVLPTLLDALNVPAPRGLRGRSLMPVARGAADTGTVVTYFEAFSGALNRGWAPITGVLRGETKYIDLPLPELYDLGADPKEQRNLADRDPGRADEMRAILRPYANAQPPTAARETEDTRDRLRSLGYVGGGETRARPTYTAADDPKRLIALDAELQAIVGQYLGGDLEGALARARDFSRAHPDMALAAMQVGHLERESGHIAAAVNAMRRALVLAPNNLQVAALLGAYLTDAGHPADAVRVLTAFAPAGGEAADLGVLVSLGLAQARLGQFDAALATLQRARSQAPHNAMLLVDVGTVSLMAGRADEARRAFESAIADNPSLARAHSSLGAIHADAGRTDAAFAEWKAATALDRSEYGRLFVLGASLVRAGRLAQARPYLEFVVASAPGDRYAQQIAQARAWLASIPR
jgi:arylsulfatase A-like enzyme/Flp pilus assembly protein TadD